VRLVGEHAMAVRVAGQDRTKQSTPAAGDIDDRGEPAELVEIENLIGDHLRDACHRGVER